MHVAAATLAAGPFFFFFLKTSCNQCNERREQKINNFFNSTLFFALCLTASCVAVTTQLIFSCSSNIWIDEAFSIALTSHSWQEMLSIAASDVHPPLYYFILKALTGLIHSIFPSFSIICIGKLISVLPFAILLVLASTKVRRAWGNFVGALWGFSLFAAPSMIFQGVEIRMYGWAMLFVSSAYLCAYDIITKNRKRDWLLFTLAGLASAYTHYYACIAVTPVYLMLLYASARKREWGNLRRWLGSATITIIGYIPWLFIFLHQAQTVSKDYWIQLPDIKEFHTYLHNFLNDSITVGIVSLIILLVLASLIRDKGKILLRNHYILSGLLCGIFTISIGLIATYLVKPVFIFRYMYPGLACFWLALIIGCNVSGKAILKIALTVTLAGTYFINMLIFGLNEGKAAKEHARFLQELSKHPDAVFITELNYQQRTLSTVLGKDCLTFDKEKSSDISRRVFSACQNPNISNLQAFLNQPNHPTYVVICTPCIQRIEISQQYCAGLFMEGAFFFQMYVIPATENGAEH